MLLSAVGIVACDGEGEVPDFPRGCDESTVDGDCIEYVGSAFTESVVETRCPNGTVVDACPEGELGQCDLSSTTVDATVSFFYPQFWTGNQAAEQCLQSGGTWTGS